MKLIFLCLGSVALSGALSGNRDGWHLSGGYGHDLVSSGYTFDGTTPCEHPTVSSTRRVGPAKLYPKASLTVGCAATLSLDDLKARFTDNCPSGKTDCTYSQSHRSVSNAQRSDVYDRYNVPSDARNIHSGEVDHLYPLCAGGANDPDNLWYQPADNKWKGKPFGYHEKDELETLICKQILAGTLDPKEAFQKITQDWVKFYQEEGLDKEQEGNDADID